MSWGFPRAKFFLMLLLAAGKVGAETTPLHDASKLLKPVEEQVLHVPGARILLADYNLLRKDFPHLQHASDAQIDEWLVAHAAQIAVPQAQQSAVNTPIHSDGKMSRAYRPKDYGRALVLDSGQGLIDAKGAGALVPTSAESRNGLLTLGEATREFLYEKVVTKILNRADSSIDTVGSYAVIDYGFDINWPDGQKSAAGLLLRQPHVRVDRPFSLLGKQSTRRVERLLRPYGITTAGAHRHLGYDLLNVQGARPLSGKDLTLIDFGAYLTLPDEDSMNSRKAHSIQDWLESGEPGPDKKFDAKKLLNPGKYSKDRTKILSSERVPFQTWGYTESGVANPVVDNPWIWSHRLIEDYKAGRASRADVENHVRNMLGETLERIEKVPCAELYGHFRP